MPASLMSTLGRLKPRQIGRVVSMKHDGPISGRLLAMGMMPGARVEVVGVAPLGDPIIVQMDGCRLSLRRDEADLLTVEHD